MRIGYGTAALGVGLLVGLGGCASNRFSVERTAMIGAASSYARIGRMFDYDKSDHAEEHFSLISRALFTYFICL